MDAKMMMDQMDASRAVMASQLQALNGVAATPLAVGVAKGSTVGAPESVFDACLQAQWSSVALTLNAMAQAEGNARDVLFARAAGSQAGAATVAQAPPDEDVIDVTAREVRV